MTQADVRSKQDEKIDEARRKLDAAIHDLTTEAGFRRWLDTRSKFHTYSFNNTVLIAAQRPDATRVAGYRKWQELGRQVRKGEKGLDIFAPITAHFDEDGKRCSAKAPGARKRVVGFKLVKVFDVSQTEGEDLGSPPPVAELDGPAPVGFLAHLGGVVEAEDLSLVARPLPKGLSGYLFAGTITVPEDNLFSAECASTIAHELGHHFDPVLAEEREKALAVGANPELASGIRYHHERGDCEAVAEACAYIVDSHFGVCADPSAPGYVLRYANGDGEVIARLAKRIDDTARKVLNGKGDH